MTLAEQQRRNPILYLIGKTLQVREHDIAHEPLPKRWVELIHHLNEQEGKNREAQPERPQKK
jgi:hypothetical protein